MWGLSYLNEKDKEGDERISTLSMDASNMGGTLMLTFHF